MLELMRRQLQRGETPVLHVMRDNAVAYAFFRRMGFVDRCEPTMRVIARELD